MPSYNAPMPSGQLTEIRDKTWANCYWPVGGALRPAPKQITATMMGSKNTLGYSGQFIYTMRSNRVRRSYTGYYPSSAREAGSILHAAPLPAIKPLKRGVSVCFKALTFDT